MNVNNEPVIFRALSHRGHVRPRNEDAVLAVPESGLWAVADGMGGHACGDVASRAVVDALQGLAGGCRGPDLLRHLPATLERVNGDLRQLARRQAGTDIMGSTVVALVLEADNYHVYWAGDSRLYLLRNGGLHRLTRDHALPPPEGRSQGPLTRAVGAGDTLEVESVQGHLYENDTFVLCSDGLTGVVPEGRIADLLVRYAPDQACHGLVQAALDAGGPDNVSCIVVTVTKPAVGPGPGQ